MAPTESLLFAANKVDNAWRAAFAAELANDRGWLDACARAIAHRYDRDPAARDGFSRVACGLVAAERRPEALEWFERDWKLDRMGRWQFLQFLDALLAQERTADAETRVEAYYRNHADAKDGWAALAMHWQKKSDPEKYAEFLRRDQRDGRSSPFWTLQLAEVEAREDDWARAQELVRSAYTANPGLRDGHMRVARIRAQAGELPAALDIAAQDRAVSRITAEALVEMAQWNGRLQRWDDAGPLVAEAYALSKKPRGAYVALARSAMRLGETATARAFYQQDRLAERISTTAKLELAALCAQGDRDEAARLIEEAYTEDPTARNAWAEIGWNAQQDGNGSALECFIRDFRLGRLTPSWTTQAIRLWCEARRSDDPLAGFLRGLVSWLSPESLALVAAAIFAEGNDEPTIPAVVNAGVIHEGRLRLKGGELEGMNADDVAEQLRDVFVDQCYDVRTAEPRPRLVDVGAGCGLVASYLRWRQPAGTIVAFEPDPDLSAALRGNVERLGWDNVTVFPANAGDRSWRETMREALAVPTDLLRLDRRVDPLAILAEISDHLDHVRGVILEFAPAALASSRPRLVEVLRASGLRIAKEQTSDQRVVRLWATRVEE